MKTTTPNASWPDTLRARADQLEREIMAARLHQASIARLQTLELELARVLDELDEWDRP